MDLKFPASAATAFFVVTLIFIGFQNCTLNDGLKSQGTRLLLSQNSFEVSAPTYLAPGFGPLGAKFANGKIYVFVGSKLLSTTDGTSWAEETSQFWQTSLQLSAQDNSGAVLQIDSNPLTFDTLTGSWQSNYLELQGPNGPVQTGVTPITIENLPGAAVEGYHTYDLFRGGDANFLSIYSVFQSSENWRGEVANASHSESFLVRGVPGDKTRYDYVSRIAGVDDYKSLLVARGLTSDAIPLYFASSPRCFAFNELRLVCALRASADDDDHARPLYAGDIFSATDTNPPDTRGWIFGARAYPLIYFPALDPSLWYKAGARDIPPLMVAVSGDGGLSWSRKLIADRGGIDAHFAYDPANNRLVLAYGGLTYPRRSIAIQSSMDFGATWSPPRVVTNDDDLFTSGTIYLEFISSGKFLLVYDSLENYFSFNPGPTRIPDGERVFARTIQF